MVSQDLSKKYYLAPSTIHGTGVIAKRKIAPSEPIDIGIKVYFGFFPVVTNYFGSYLNHQGSPNTYLAWSDQDYWIFANRTIQVGEELTMNYQQTPWYIMGPDVNWN